MSNAVKFMKDDNSILLKVYHRDRCVGTLLLTQEPKWYFCSGYYYQTIEWMNSEDLRVIADKLDELNNVQ